MRAVSLLPALLTALLLVPRQSPAGQENTLESLKTAYGNERLVIATTSEQHKQDALKKYGKALDGLLTALKQKGDLKTYLVVEAEKKRYDAKQTVPNAKDVAPVLTDTVRAYQKEIRDAGTELNRQTASLLEKYLSALDGLIVTLMKVDKIEDAKTVQAESDIVSLELADLESKLPPEPSVVKTQRVETVVRRKLKPKEAKAFKGHHYLFVTGKLTWHQARKACEEMGGHLVTIASKEENDFVLSVVGRQIGWIGCTDEKKEGDWLWVDGSQVSFAEWLAEEPNNGGPNGPENYAQLDPRNPAKWSDTPDDGWNITGYVCEWDY